MSELIDIQAFVNYLRENDLVIVSRRMIEKKRPDVKWLLKRKSVSINELARSGILPVKTKQSVRNWIDAGKIRPDAVFKDKNGKLRIANAEIKRLIKTYTNEKI